MNNHNKEKTALFAALLLVTGNAFANTDYADLPIYDATSVQHANLNNAVADYQQTPADPEDIIYLDEQPAPQQDYMQSAQAPVNEDDIIYLDEQPSAQSPTVAQSSVAELVHLNDVELEASGIVFLDEMPTQTTLKLPPHLNNFATPQQPPQTTTFRQGPIAAPAADDVGYAMYADQSGQAGPVGPASTAMPTQDIAANSAYAAPTDPTLNSSVRMEEVIKTVEAGRIDRLAALEARGVDLNATDSNGLTYLHRAAAAGHVKMTQYLLRAGLNPNASTSKNWTPLHHAARFGHSDVVAALLAAGSDERQMTSDGFSPKRLAINAEKYQVAGLLR